MELPFYTENDSPAGETLQLVDGELYFYPQFMTVDQANACFEELETTTPWQQDYLNFGGKRVAIPRLQAWVGDKHSHYGYSGLALSPLPWTDLLANVKAHIESVAGTRFNSVLLNYYRHGNDSVAWHSDDENELGNDPVIASLSLGATRRFELKHRHKAVAKSACELSHGSLMIMGRGIQQHWQHQVPKQPIIHEPRINLTFRYIVS